ncbi:hypothetical protein M153_11900017607 [Pseudoloma neurophilia]|uniref:Uncharacterized protein n=1 Tax=Pseudoloma neurophilia TaxID=146866 RepID=A0A0R0M7F9_9MICR|nr:hypothetical protein M153_11900017607 [Pseudoloma neurophilia]
MTTFATLTEYFEAIEQVNMSKSNKKLNIHSFGQIIYICSRYLIVKYENHQVKIVKIDPSNNYLIEIECNKYRIDQWIRFYGKMEQFFSKKSEFDQDAMIGPLRRLSIDTRKNNEILTINCIMILSLEGIDINLLERVCGKIKESSKYIKH